jgi:chromosome segregation ATPase
VQIQLDEQTKSVFELQGLQRARVVTLEETIVALKGAADAAKAEVAEANAHTVELEVDLEKTRTELTAELEIARVDIAAHRASITDGVARLHALLTGPVVNNGEGLHALLAQPAVDNDAASDPPSQALSGVLTSLEAAYAALLLRATTAEANATTSAAGTQDLQARVDAELAAKEQTVSALSMTIATAMAEAESAATARNELVAELQAAREAQEAGAESLAATVAELTASTLLAEGLRRELEDSSRLVEAGVKLEVEHAESVQKLKQTIADLHNDLDEAVQQKEDELGNLAVELAETKANLHQYQGGSSPTPARRSLGSHSLSVTDTDDSIGLQTAGRPVPKSDSNTNDPGLAWLGGWLFDS